MKPMNDRMAHFLLTQVIKAARSRERSAPPPMKTLWRDILSDLYQALSRWPNVHPTDEQAKDMMIHKIILQARKAETE